MGSRPNAKGIVAVLEGDVQPDLRRLAELYSLCVLESPAVEQALQALRCMRPQALLVQVDSPDGPAVRLIRQIGEAGLQIPVIAVAIRHTCDLERASLVAGATCYVPSPCPGAVGLALQGMLAPANGSTHPRLCPGQAQPCDGPSASPCWPLDRRPSGGKPTRPT